MFAISLVIVRTDFAIFVKVDDGFLVCSFGDDVFEDVFEASVGLPKIKSAVDKFLAFFFAISDRHGLNISFAQYLLSYSKNKVRASII